MPGMAEKGREGVGHPPIALGVAKVHVDDLVIDDDELAHNFGANELVLKRGERRLLVVRPRHARAPWEKNQIWWGKGNGGTFRDL